jgi:predicted DNA-binding WGR domain protein
MCQGCWRLPVDSRLGSVVGMTQCLLTRRSRNRRLRPSFYRVEIAHNLFGEYSVIREWGRVGGRSLEKVDLFEGLVEASRWADRVRRKRLRAGYARIE